VPVVSIVRALERIGSEVAARQPDALESNFMRNEHEHLIKGRNRVGRAKRERERVARALPPRYCEFNISAVHMTHNMRSSDKSLFVLSLSPGWFQYLGFLRCSS
jgi:hypothetical protein